jgi:hypothetical protein
MEIEEYINEFHERIPIYRNSLLKLRGGWKNDQPGLINLFGPLISRTYLIWLLDYLKQYTTDTSQLENDFLELDKYYMDYKEKNRDAYFLKIYSDFTTLVEGYHPDGVLVGGYTFETVIFKRTYIGMFSKELEGVFDTSKFMDTVEKLDIELKEKIKDAVKLKTYSPQDRPYAPREYWWLHLEDVYGSPEEIID